MTIQINIGLNNFKNILSTFNNAKLLRTTGKERIFFPNEDVEYE